MSDSVISQILSALPLKPAPPSRQPYSPLLEPSPAPRPTSSFPSKASKGSRRVKTIPELKDLIEAAYAGDDTCLTRVRAFCASAHGKPRHKRTNLHRYVIKHWREPPRSIPSASLVETTLDGDTFSAAIYVDASSWGIGFVMDGLWLSWKFADSDSQIDGHWADMLAVEVGLWTVVLWVCSVIHREGDESKSLEILIRSDNAGVVKAIEDHHTDHALQQDILQRILYMVTEDDIQLEMEWIPSSDKLADKISRGVPGRMADLLPFIPSLPSYLSDMLNPFRQAV